MDRLEMVLGEVPFDVRWRSATSEGNVAFGQGAFARARWFYEGALVEARVLVARAVARPTIELCVAPALLTISFHNLAEVFRRLGCEAEADERVASAFDELLRIAQSSRTPLAVRSSAARQLQPALAELAAEHSRRGRVELIAAATDRARRATDAVVRAQSRRPAAS